MNTAWKCFAVKGFLLFRRWDDVWWFYYFVKPYRLDLCTEVFMDEINITYGFSFKIIQKKGKWVGVRIRHGWPGGYLGSLNSSIFMYA